MTIGPDCTNARVGKLVGDRLDDNDRQDRMLFG